MHYVLMYTYRFGPGLPKPRTYSVLSQFEITPALSRAWARTARACGRVFPRRDSFDCRDIALAQMRATIDVNPFSFVRMHREETRIFPMIPPADACKTKGFAPHQWDPRSACKT